jgi:oligopeptide/dipeptide ABC transporter ATP-binding protein
MSDTVLEVEDLCTDFAVGRQAIHVVDRVSFTLRRGRTTAIVGESGSGKTVTALSLLQLIEPPGRITGGAIRYGGRDLRQLDERAMQTVRGARIGMVFQDPLSSLNPSLRIGTQIAETLLAHVLIAMAIACNPDIIIADEPTTALDVTVQAKILRLLHDLQQAMGLSLLMITHDLGVVAALADEVVVMYAGRVVERADVDSLFHSPLHPYTRALLACAISLDDDRATPLEPIAGAPPDLRHRPTGCQFAPRCPVAIEKCRRLDPPLLPMAPHQDVACFVAQGNLDG